MLCRHHGAEARPAAAAAALKHRNGTFGCIISSQKVQSVSLRQPSSFLHPVIHMSSFHDPVTSARPRTSAKYSGHLGDRSVSDLDANPRRLLQIGDELQRLTAVVSATPGTAGDCSVSPREKNKYASRICRLKRKAQHEANKIKLQGLEQEHRECRPVCCI